MWGVACLADLDDASVISLKSDLKVDRELSLTAASTSRWTVPVQERYFILEKYVT